MSNTDKILMKARTAYEKGDMAAAARHYKAILKRTPNHLEALSFFGQAYLGSGRLEEAARAYRKVLELKPDSVVSLNNLGFILQETGRPEEAISLFARAVAVDPAYREGRENLADALLSNGDMDRAIDAYRDALKRWPQAPSLLSGMGRALLVRGDVADARKCFEGALSLDPGNTKFQSESLFARLYDPAFGPEAVYRDHLKWGRACLSGIPEPPPPGNTPDPDRPLKVAYLSPDFRTHSVANFFEPILAAHDQAHFSVTCYANVGAEDDTTERLRRMATNWLDVWKMSDAELAQRIRDDRIDILVDLAGHTGNTRVRVLAHRAAPVQVTYLGYPATTGLSTVDYRLTDAMADPEHTDGWHTEQLIRLPGGFCCYLLPPHLPDVSPLPARKTGHLTFGSLANACKISPDLIRLWSRVLHEVPGAKLFLFRKDFRNPAMQERIRAQFGAHGIDPGTILCTGERLADNREFLANYHQVDISLDTFPYTGHTTTCESLAMGVPVITRAGRCFLERCCASVLTLAGCSQWVAEDEDAYVALARELATDLDGLARIRAGLRERLAASPLCDAAGFTRRLENSYREMWRTWCRTAS
ncbi:MAG: tetratricopeptide repeat protein [Leptospirillia bacterium]